MKPYAHTEGDQPRKRQTGVSYELSSGINFKRVKAQRKEAQHLAQLDNKRARKKAKNRLHRLFEFIDNPDDEIIEM